MNSGDIEGLSRLPSCARRGWSVLRMVLPLLLLSVPARGWGQNPNQNVKAQTGRNGDLGEVWGLNQTAGAELKLAETRRGRRPFVGTDIEYHFLTKGFPPGKTYTLWLRDAIVDEIVRLDTGFTADPGGSLVCAPEVPKEEKSGSRTCTAGRRLEDMSIALRHPARGEAIEMAVVSTDQSVRAFARQIPFPIEGRDGSCHLSVELASKDGARFLVFGDGFGPHEDIETVSRVGKEQVEGQTTASPNGEFTAVLDHHARGKHSGSATYTATGKSCRPTVEYRLGKGAFRAP